MTASALNLLSSSGWSSESRTENPSPSSEPRKLRRAACAWLNRLSQSRTRRVTMIYTLLDCLCLGPAGFFAAFPRSQCGAEFQPRFSPLGRAPEIDYPPVLGNLLQETRSEKESNRCSTRSCLGYDLVLYQLVLVALSNTLSGETG